MEERVGPQVVFNLFGNSDLPITNSLIVSWGIIIGLIIFARIFTKKFKLKPGPVQNVLEFIVITIENQIEPMLPGESRKYLPLIATIFIYIACANLIVIIPGVASPTSDLNTTLGLGLLVFVVSHFEGIREKGIRGYVKGYAEPVFFLLPLNVVGELAKPISHSFRLFGNMLGAAIIIALVYVQVPLGLRILLPIPLHLWFDVFVGAVQALIFGMVAIVYITVAKQ